MKKITKMRRMMQLRTLGRKLLKVPDSNFNMLCWTIIRGGAENLTAPKNLKKLDCGFVACAIGWFPTLVPAARAEGFKLKISPEIGAPTPHYKEAPAWTAVEKYFGISAGDAKKLFDAHSYTSTRDDESVDKKDVSERLIEFANKTLKELRSV